MMYSKWVNKNVFSRLKKSRTSKSGYKVAFDLNRANLVTAATVRILQNNKLRKRGGIQKEVSIWTVHLF